MGEQTRRLLSGLYSLPLLCLSFEALGQEYRKYFRDWLVTCRPDSAVCKAHVYFKLQPNNKVADFQMHLARPGDSGEQELLFVPLNAWPRADSSITIQIDEELPFEARPETGWYRQGGLNEYAFEPRLVQSMLPMLKKGLGVTLSYTDWENQPTEVRFSLLGLTAALADMDRWRQANAQPHQRVDAPAFPQALQCSGNEPFWSLELSSEQALFKRLVAQQETTTLQGGYRILDYLEPKQLAWRGRSPDEEHDLVLFIRGERCSDTMSDIRFPYQVILSTPSGDVLTGCCREPQPAD